MSGCSSDDIVQEACLRGEGNREDMEIPGIAGFNSIAMFFPGELIITQGANFSLEITAQDTIAEAMTKEVVDGELQLRFDRCIIAFDSIFVRVTMPDIESLKLEGSGNIIAENDWNLDNLDLSISGEGNATLTGTVENFNISLEGTGDVHAFDLESTNCSVNLSGMGNVEVFANNTLDVNIQGSGNVNYKGNPTVTSEISGIGSVINSN
ncbi:head GIN domain-containing protein [Fulvivirgaceae bacterium BMA10]|uniref:Head GIN domain-containing protein n=2 Tax=Splendidivirga corallicola TaxID=3051826 RepID=A0ABT8KWW4_9BACT|nr:head GIN domain-containing protein [Fulvivirgaceae bacterium BMA10]